MRRVAIVAIGAGLCAAGLFLWAHNRAPQGRPSRVTARPSIVLITIDTLRADRVGRGLTPSLDALAADGGARFTHARAAVPLTLPSHTTIMTGTLPPVHGIHDNGATFEPGPVTLAHVLGGAGYRTGAFVGAYVLNHVFGLDDGFDVYDDRVHRDPDLGAQLEAERRGGEVMDAALEWLRTVPDGPFFLWVHLYDPHAPYDPPAEFLARAGGNAYDGEVAYADAQVGRLLAALRDRGAYGDAVIAVAGDHGEGLGEHGEQAHGMLAYDSTLRVPLILHGPGVAAGTFDQNVSLAALAGALVRLSGSRVPSGMSEGAPLPSQDTAEVYAETEYPRVAGWHGLTALVADRWKLILSSEAELYDVAADPGERHDVAAGHRATVEAMRARLGALSAPSGRRAEAEISPEAADRLRALGYVGGSASTPVDAGAAPNPAHHIADWTAFEQALTDVNAGRAAAALPRLKALAAKNPGAPVFQSTYARALKDTGSPDAAVAVYRRAVARWPADPSLYHDLAVAARAAGDSGEALRAEQAALALDGSDAAALNGLGLLKIDAGDAAAAADAFERAAAEDPSNASFWTNLGNARRELGNLDRAESAYRRALQIDTSYADANNGLGVVLVQRQRPDDAIEFLEQAVASDPHLYEAQLNLGIACQESGDRSRAADTYRQLLATAPPSAAKERKAAATLLAGLK